jgi:hypothetical protein
MSGCADAQAAPRIDPFALRYAPALIEAVFPAQNIR